MSAHVSWPASWQGLQESGCKKFDEGESGAKELTHPTQLSTHACRLSALVLLTVRFRKLLPKSQSIPDMHTGPATPGATKILVALSS